MVKILAQIDSCVTQKEKYRKTTPTRVFIESIAGVRVFPLLSSNFIIQWYFLLWIIPLIYNHDIEMRWRIRQQEKNARAQFPHHTRINPNNLWKQTFIIILCWKMLVWERTCGNIVYDSITRPLAGHILPHWQHEHTSNHFYLIYIKHAISLWLKKHQ